MKRIKFFNDHDCFNKAFKPDATYVYYPGFFKYIYRKLLKTKGKSYSRRFIIGKKEEAIIKRPPLYKRFRSDLILWEEKYVFAKIFTIYIYSIWKKGRLHKTKSLLKKQKSACEYVNCVPLSPVTIGKKEFKECYNNNKRAVPINMELNLNLP